MAHLITPSLYESYRWYIALEDKPVAELLATLRKERTPDNEAMAAGRLFEDQVRGLQDFSQEKPDYKDCVLEVRDIIGPAIWQQAFHRQAIINGAEYLLYARTDAIFRDTIYDVKKSSSYDIGKYHPSCQHGITLYAARFDKFKYVISDGRNVYCEDYAWHDGSKDELFGRLATMLQHLQDVPELWDAYQQNWVSRGD